MWVALLRLWLRLGGSPMSAVGRRLLVRAIADIPAGGSIEIRGDGRWWNPIRARRDVAPEDDEALS